MGKANLYTVKDYQTGEVLAKGTAGELEASGIVPKGYHTSEWVKHENQKRRNRKYAISFEERQPEVKRGEKGRMMSVYTCYNAAGDVIGEGTARELWEAGVFSNDNAAYYTYKEQGGRCIKRGIAKMTCRKEMRKVGQNNARGEKGRLRRKEAGAARPAEDKRPDAAGLRRPRPDDLQRHRQKGRPAGADLRLLGGGRKAGKTMRAPCKDCPKRRPLCHDRCETYRRWKEEKAKETAYTKQKREDAVIYRKDFDKEFWM